MQDSQSTHSQPSAGEEEVSQRSPWRLLAYGTLGALVLVLATIGVLVWNLVSGVAGEPPSEDVGSDEEPSDADAARVEANPDEPLNILLLGIDAGVSESGRRGPQRSDTVMLLSLDPLTGHASLLSIPRDTRVRIPVEQLDEAAAKRVRENPTKMGHVHAFGGPELAMLTVSDFLDVPIHRYVRVDLEAFTDIVDLLGGVHICVKRRMYYEDPVQNLLIDLHPGCQDLDGSDALGYVRYRGDNDFRRMDRQQEVLQALVDQHFNLSVVPQLPGLVREITESVDTNFSRTEILHLARRAAEVAAGDALERLSTGTVPGRDAWVPVTYGGGKQNVYYWIPDEDGTRELVDALIWRIPAPEDTDLQIMVRNASGSEEIGAEVADYLRSHGYDVIRVVQETELQEQTEIILHGKEDQIREKIVARAIAHYVKTARVYAEPEELPGHHLTVLLGRDVAMSGVQTNIP